MSPQGVFLPTSRHQAGDPLLDVQRSPRTCATFVDAPYRRVSRAGRQCAPTTFRPQRRERVVRIRVTQLHHLLRSGQVVQPKMRSFATSLSSRSVTRSPVPPTTMSGLCGQLGQPWAGAVDAVSSYAAPSSGDDNSPACMPMRSRMPRQRAPAVAGRRHGVGCAGRTPPYVAFALFDRADPAGVANQFGHWSSLRSPSCR